MVQLEKARTIGKAGGLFLFVAGILLLVLSMAIGWGFQHYRTALLFIFFIADGAFIAAFSSRRTTFDGENAAIKAALSGYKASEEVKRKYEESAGRSIVLFVILFPFYTAFWMLYTYFVVEPVIVRQGESNGLAMLFGGAIPNFLTYSVIFGFLAILWIAILIIVSCFYLRGRELRRFYWRVYGWGRRKTRGYSPEKT